MNPDFPELTALAVAWQGQQPLSAQQNDRLWKKLRLEWNYHSNHIEGNTLTYGETELLLLHDRTTGNHTHREYLEMKAHNVGIEHVRALAADSHRPLTEADIRDLNRIILKEPFWKPASTVDGQATRKEIIPGQYKTTPNSVRTATGEMFYYASVEDTPPRMQALVAWLQQELAVPTIHPVALATRLHYDFVRIHPFDDGNGRVARLLVNYVLMRAGYLPVIVRTEDKKNYLTVLQLADAGDLKPLIDYFANLAEWSLKLGLKAAKGEPVDEPSDVEKEIALFVRSQQGHMEGAQPRTSENIKELVNSGLLEFLKAIDPKVAQLSPLFQSWNFSSNSPRALGNMHPAEGLRYFSMSRSWDTEFEITYSFNTYLGRGRETFDLQFSVGVSFKPMHYEIRIVDSEPIRKSYTDFLGRDEQALLVSKLLGIVLQMIKAKSGNPEE